MEESNMTPYEISRLLSAAESYMTKAEEANPRNLFSKSTYLKAAENTISHVAGTGPLSGTNQERLRALKWRLERMQQRKEGMDYYSAQRLLQQARADRESARQARKAKRFRDAHEYARRSADAQSRVERECSRDTIARLGSLYRNAVRNNGKLAQSIRDEEYAHGHAPSMRACPAPAPAVPTVRNTNVSGGNHMLNLSVTTVRVIDGHVGQVYLNGDIVWQSKPFAKDETGKKGRVVKTAASLAHEAATDRINKKFKDLLAN
jgi:hypothetical protein